MYRAEKDPHAHPRFAGPAPLDVPLCRGKVSYPTWAAAKAAAGRTRRDSGGAARLQPFVCHYCHRIHIGNGFAPRPWSPRRRHRHGQY